MIIGHIVSAIQAKDAQLSRSVARAFWHYDWPLNIRELEQTLRRAIVLAGAEPVALAHLPAAIAGADIARTCRSGAPPEPMRNSRIVEGSISPHEQGSDADATLQRELVSWLEHHKGNVARVARSMGRSRLQVHRWMRRLSIVPQQFRNQK